MRNIVKVAAVAVGAGALAVGGVAFAAEPATPSIYGCVDKNGGIRIVAAGEACKNKETALSWNAAGQPGPAGPQGPAGPAGQGGGVPVENSSVIGKLTLDGVQGGDPASTTIDLRGYSFEAKATPGNGAGSSGKTTFSDFSFVKAVDLSSPVLMRSIGLGRHYQTAKLEIYREGTMTVAETFVLDEVLLTSLESHDDGSQGGVPLEDVSVSYEQISQTYTPSSGPAVTAEWDLQSNS
jgi:type VI secretion system Hcp family effector